MVEGPDLGLLGQAAERIAIGGIPRDDGGAGPIERQAAERAPTTDAHESVTEAGEIDEPVTTS